MTRILFIGGAGRSGTTLFERVLARAESTVALGEVMHLWQRGIAENQLCGCGVPFHECPFWHDVGRDAFGGWDRIDPDRLEHLRQRVDRARNIPGLATRTVSRSFASDTAEYASYYDRLYRAAAAVSGAHVVLDSSKQVSLPFVLRGRTRAELRVAQLVRDPRGVAYSWTKEVTRPEITSGDVLMPQYSPRSTSLTWLVHNGGFDVLRAIGTPVGRWRYEDFVAHPAETVSQVTHFAGTRLPTEVSDQLAAGLVDLGVDHTAAGNPMRFRTGPLRLRLDDDWAQQLPPSDQVQVARWTSPLRAWYSRTEGTPEE